MLSEQRNAFESQLQKQKEFYEAKLARADRLLHDSYGCIEMGEGLMSRRDEILREERKHALGEFALLLMAGATQMTEERKRREDVDHKLSEMQDKLDALCTSLDQVKLSTTSAYVSLTKSVN
jgi:hypothetical protein